MDSAGLTKENVEAFVQEKWPSILKSLEDFIRIPNLSPAFDEKWNQNGRQEDAAKHILDWALAQGVEGIKGEIIKEKDLTPIVFIEIEGKPNINRNILMYGHFDKQPPFEGWNEGLAPTKPVLIGDKLYGRGGADDGYAIYGCIMSVLTCQKFKIPHGRCVILIEGSEESGSIHLPNYVDKLKDRIGELDTILCLDSGCGNYEQLWITTSLRGLTMIDLTVQILTEGVHSGDASGIVPDSFRILRMLMERIEDSKTGQIVLDGFVKEVPHDKVEQAKYASEVMGDTLSTKFPFVPGAYPTYEKGKEGDLKRYLARAWGNVVTVTGAGGLPPIATAGNVLRTETTARLSIRLNPNMDAKKAESIVKSVLEQDPPYGAKITVKTPTSANGWMSPAFDPWINQVMNKASNAFWGKDSVMFGEGGSIPFMGMLGEKFPKAQFVVTGILGPNSNAHGPNEFLHVPMTKKIMGAMAMMLERHAKG